MLQLYENPRAGTLIEGGKRTIVTVLGVYATIGENGAVDDISYLIGYDDPARPDNVLGTDLVNTHQVALFIGRG